MPGAAVRPAFGELQSGSTWTFCALCEMQFSGFRTPKHPEAVVLLCTQVWRILGGAAARRVRQSTEVCISDVIRNCGGTGGCAGATVELAMAYVVQNGLATESRRHTIVSSSIQPLEGLWDCLEFNI